MLNHLQRGTGGELLGEGQTIFLTLHSPHQNDLCAKMGSDENHFNVSLVEMCKVTRQCPWTTIFEKKGKLKGESNCLLAFHLTTRPNWLWTYRVLIFMFIPSLYLLFLNCLLSSLFYSLFCMHSFIFFFLIHCSLYKEFWKICISVTISITHSLSRRFLKVLVWGAFLNSVGSVFQWHATWKPNECMTSCILDNL